MSKKKGLSIEEKISKVHEYFKENQTPFTLKELIAQIPKAKGVIHQSIEECLESLVADDLVKSEKVGVSTLYWSFTADASVGIVANITRMERQLTTLEAEKQRVQDALQEYQDAEASSADDLADITIMLGEIEVLTKKKLDLHQQMTQRAEEDPEMVNNVLNAADVAKTAANRWTDNFFILEDLCQKKGGFCDSQNSLRSQLGVSLQLDYLEMC